MNKIFFYFVCKYFWSDDQIFLLGVVAQPEVFAHVDTDQHLEGCGAP